MQVSDDIVTSPPIEQICDPDVSVVSAGTSIWIIPFVGIVVLSKTTTSRVAKASPTIDGRDETVT